MRPLRACWWTCCAALTFDLALASGSLAGTPAAPTPRATAAPMAVKGVQPSPVRL